MVDNGTVRVVGLCGSLRADGFTRMALSIALSGAQEKGAAVELVDLRDYGLPVCTGEMQDASQNTPGVQRLRQRVMEASGDVGRKVARLARMLASKEARELLQLWEEVDE